MMVTTMMIVIDAPHLYAMVSLTDDAVTGAPPILKYMKGWSRFRVLDYCETKGWKATEMDDADPQDTDKADYQP